MPSVSTRRWTCPSQPSKPAGHVPRPRPALDMSLGGPKSRRACASARASTGHAPWRAQIRLDMSLGAGQGWAYWHYVHCSGPTLGMSRGGNGVSAHAREGTFHGTRESCGTCPAARTNTGHVPLRAKIPLGMSLGAGQGWAYWHYVRCSGPTLGMSRLGNGSLRMPMKARSAERVNPAAHVRPRGPTLDMSL
jgi:hypothetical protein